MEVAGSRESDGSVAARRGFSLAGVLSRAKSEGLQL